MTAENNPISIGDAARILNVTIETLRRWDHSGKLKANRTRGEQRRYTVESIQDFLTNNLFWGAKRWAQKSKSEPDGIFYCPTRPTFETRNAFMEKRLADNIGDVYSLISSSIGEIGNNSFDHNLGRWPDVMGVYFGYNIEKRRIVLADKGLGILKTLQRVVPGLSDHKKALHTAFTEIITGRAPENRGNGLKYIIRNVENGHFSLTFQTGNAEMVLKAGESFTADNIKIVKYNIPGCLALISF